MTKRHALKFTALTLTVVFLFCGACILFVQFYPFPTSPVRTKFHYPTVTNTSSGAAGDPINLMFLGSKSAIQEAFTRAGWSIPDPITPKTSAKIALDALANLPYPTAPVSNLYLYHRKQDMAFERPTKTVQIRDHIRIWDTHTTFGSQEVWLASATYDHGIEISGKTDMPTHHVAANVDKERDLVYQTLKPYMQFGIVIPFAQPTFFGTNGGGDWYYTDGDIAVLSTVGKGREIFASGSSPAIVVKGWIFEFASFLLRPVA